jgi:hypothetical protein
MSGEDVERLHAVVAFGACCDWCTRWDALSRVAGQFLIKRVVDELKRELPGLTTFVTLSPIPGARLPHLHRD